MAIYKVKCAWAEDWPPGVVQGVNLIPPYLLCILYINHQPTSPATKTIRAHVYSATNLTTFRRKPKIAPTTLLTIASNASTDLPASLLSAFASLSNHFFQVPFVFWWRTSCPSTSSKGTCNSNDNRWKSYWKDSQFWKYGYALFTKNGYEFFLLKTYFDQEHFQGFAWSLQLGFEDLFSSVTVFLALSVFRYSAHLIYLCITAFVHQYKQDHFLLLPTFLYLFWYAY